MKSRLLIFIIMTTHLSSCRLSDEHSAPKIKEGFVEVTGGKVWYRIVGAEKKGIPLLTLHGGPGAPHDYLEPMQSLADERPVIFYDQLGCGFSDRPSDTNLWTVQRFVEELAQLRTALKLEKIHIMGQSWGTMLAVEYMIRNKPDNVESLILSGAYLSTARWVADQRNWISQLPQNVQDTIIKYEEIGDFSSSAYQEAMMHFYSKHLCRLDPWPDCLNRAMEKMGFEVYEHMWGPSEFTMTGTLKNADLTDQLHQIKVPVMFTCGEFDEATPETTNYFKSKIEKAEMHVLIGASHSHQVEKPEEYVQVLRAFLRKVENKN
jgi:proline iminopeptidase